ncbi:protein phosphatase 2C domain-containing protein [Streptomyces sp. BE303]|uniref:protein phosphatase 2C domain-containing protein n=1 Tax=Streptomyces sp. BE303 TaxID=3002528 RepID=UPI002E76094B|nr:protein phosphatase 2C domain-containing protein [Streptomyces sp. BE303]MED7953055.1 protein phosphatase 2C domain-containing protein [Streptomyces sp. BE303]
MTAAARRAAAGGGAPIVAGAVVQGTGHLASGRGCQDAFKAAAGHGDDGPTTAGGRPLVLAVADGAGSRDRSALGAHLAVDAACRLLATDVPPADGDAAVWRGWIGERSVAVVDAYLRAVRAVLAADHPDPAGAADDADTVGAAGTVDSAQADEGALAATLVAAVLRPPWVAFLALGDCFATVLTRTRPGDDGDDGDRGHDGDGERCRLVLPPRTPAVFLSTPGARASVTTLVLREPDLSGVVLATDGCAPLALDHPSVLGLPDDHGPLAAPDFFGPLAALLRANGGDAEPLRALLSGPAAARSGDDLTVLCALRPDGARWL